jgi:ankyrin repeat protein
VIRRRTANGALPALVLAMAMGLLTADAAATSEPPAERLVDPVEDAMRRGKADLLAAELQARPTHPLVDGSGNPLLHRAAARGRVDMVRVLLDHGADVHARSAIQQTAMMFAARSGHVAVMSLLDERGADVGTVAGNGRIALHFAAAGGHTEAAQWLIGLGSPVDVADASGATPVLLAARAGSAATVALLLRNGADATHLAADGRNALHEAALSGSAPTLAVVLSVVGQIIGFDIDLRDGAGHTALALAAAAGAPENFQTLLDITRHTLPESTSELLAAVLEDGDDKGIELLARNGADWTRTDEDGRDAVLAAAAAGRGDILTALLALGASAHTVSARGATALHEAAAAGCLHCVTPLVEAGLAVDSRIDGDPRRGWTPLMAAAAFGHASIVAALMREGADPLSRSSGGRDALQLAACQNHASVVRMLLPLGGDPEHLDDDGLSARSCVELAGHWATLDVLDPSGAEGRSAVRARETARRERLLARQAAESEDDETADDDAEGLP